MGLYLSKQDNQTELQKRITADLRIKASAKAKQAEEAEHDANYLAGTKRTTSLAGVWIFILVVGVVMVVLFIANSISR